LKLRSGGTHSQVRLLIPSFDANKADIHIYKTAHSERLMMDCRVEAVEGAMATAAAPTYFPAYDSKTNIAFVDGGLWGNNPVALAVVEAITLLGQDPDNIDVLSLGCTDEPIDFKAGWHTDLYWLCLSEVSSICEHHIPSKEHQREMLSRNLHSKPQSHKTRFASTDTPNRRLLLELV
jgi:patatin-like phospholipase/acyl hydrolase